MLELYLLTLIFIGDASPASRFGLLYMELTKFVSVNPGLILWNMNNMQGVSIGALYKNLVGAFLYFT